MSKRMLFWSLVMTLCLMTAPAFAAKTLKFGHNTKPDQPSGKAATHFAELVKQKTNGDILIDVFPTNQLGKNKQMVENARLGAQDIVMAGLGVLAYMSDAFTLMQIPYVFDSQDHVHKALASPLGEDLTKEMLGKGLVMLTMSWDRMPRHIAGGKPIRTVDDFKGYKVRTSMAAFLNAFQVMGGSPQDLPLNEMYMALQQGVIEGAELPTDYVYEYSIYEVCKYFNKTYHTFGTQCIAIGKRTWDKLSQTERQALQEAAVEAGEFNNKLTNELEETYEAKLKEAGMEFIDSPRQEFQKMVRDNIAQATAGTKNGVEIFNRIQAAK